MTTVTLGLAVPLLWGSADTVAVFATKRIGTSATTIVAQLAGLFLVALVTLAYGGSLGMLPGSASELLRSFLFGVVLGCISAGAYLFLYKALAYGPLAVASPVVSAQGGVTLLLAVVLLQEHLMGFQMFFLLISFVGVMLASLNIRELVRMKLREALSPGVMYALISLLCFGTLSFGLGLAARETNWLISVLWIRFCSFGVLAAFLRSDLPSTGKAGATWGYLLAVVVGCADIGGLTILSLATASGSIGIAGMISSAYGVIPLVAGVFLLKEHPTRGQILGCLLLGAGLAGEAATGAGQEIPLVGIAIALLVGYALDLFYPYARELFTARRVGPALVLPFNPSLAGIPEPGLASPHALSSPVGVPRYANTVNGYVFASNTPRVTGQVATSQGSAATPKHQGRGQWCVLSVEPSEKPSTLFDTIAGLKTPVVLVVGRPTRGVQSPMDFVALKHLRRRLNIQILFVIPPEQQALATLARRHGFPVYLSMEHLSQARRGPACSGSIM